MQTSTDLATARADQNTAAAGLQRATVRSDVAELEDIVLVTVDGESPTLKRPAVGWAPHGDAYPQTGDRAWVQRAGVGVGELVVVAWRGISS